MTLQPAEKIPVLLDTDIGGDIDDALCLVYLLRQARCELVGITTVTGEPERRAMLASAICRAEGRGDIPIHSGSPVPLLIEQRQAVAHQAEALPRWPHQESFDPCTAVEFMRQTIRSRPGEITLLAIGPMTNLGILFRLDPEVPSLLKSLVLMCGLFTHRVEDRGPTEWNASCDPHAASIVYTAGSQQHISLGLDVTVPCVLEAETCRRRFKGGGLDVAADMAEVWFRTTDRIYFHDPLAGAVLFAPDLVDCRPGRVEVELGNPGVDGITRWSADPSGPHQVAMEVRPEEFFRHYFEVLEQR